MNPQGQGMTMEGMEAAAMLCHHEQIFEDEIYYVSSAQCWTVRQLHVAGRLHIDGEVHAFGDVTGAGTITGDSVLALEEEV